MTEEEKNTTLEWRTLYMFNKRGGKLVKCIEGRGRGMLMMWALQNTTKSRVSVIVIKDTNEVEVVHIGKESGCPKVIYLYKMPQYDINLNDYINDETHIDINGLMLLEELN